MRYLIKIKLSGGDNTINKLCVKPVKEAHCSLSVEFECNPKDEVSVIDNVSKIFTDLYVLVFIDKIFVKMMRQFPNSSSS